MYAPLKLQVGPLRKRLTDLELLLKKSSLSLWPSVSVSRLSPISTIVHRDSPVKMTIHITGFQANVVSPKTV